MANQVTLKPVTPPKTDYSRLKTTLVVSDTKSTNNSLFQTVDGLIGAAKTFSEFVTGSFNSFTGGFASINSILNTLTQAASDFVAELQIRNSQDFGVFSYGSSADNVSTSTGTKLSLNADLFGSMRQGGNIVVPSEASGQYAICGHVEFSFNATGYRQITISVNDAVDYVVAKLHGGLTDTMVIPFNILLSLAEGDYVSIYAYQTSGVALQVTATLQMFRVSYS